MMSHTHNIKPLEHPVLTLYVKCLVQAFFQETKRNMTTHSAPEDSSESNVHLFQSHMTLTINTNTGSGM